MKYKYLSCNKHYSNKIVKELKKRLNAFKFSNNDTNKSILMLRKGVYPYQYINEWKHFNEIPLPEKEEFCSNLNIENLTYADCMHAKRLYKDFDISIFGEYYDLYLKSDILLLVDVSKNFRKMCLKIYHLDPAKFLSAPGLAWQAALKKLK